MQTIKVTWAPNNFDTQVASSNLQPLLLQRDLLEEGLSAVCNCEDCDVL